MDFIILLLYGLVNFTIIIKGLSSKQGYFYFPFWISVISLGWFYPQAIGGYFHIKEYPPYSYISALLFATICNISLFFGWYLSVYKHSSKKSWLSNNIEENRLYNVGAFFCLFGFYFQIKLWSLPEEMLDANQWSGATVKYLFLGSVFKYGFIILWMQYLKNGKWLNIKYLIFIVPCALLLLNAAVLLGRRSEMMNITVYLIFGLWFAKGIVFPRKYLIVGLCLGLILINSIGLYRGVMKDRDLDLATKISIVTNANYLEQTNKIFEGSGVEFENYLFSRQAYEDYGDYDFGAYHWNRVVLNYFPAQIFGNDLKNSLMIPTIDIIELISYRYGAYRPVGSTATGYLDSFGSFGWLGFIKFLIIGYMMGTLFKSAKNGYWLPQLLYLSFLTVAMVSITHNTNDILVRVWIYFFIIIYPMIRIINSRF
ncbi:hypothetical protein R7Z10_12115 [Vibrio sp. Vb1018]|uniref:hypothetical protein n=1 Tax=Vibrio sp. Vb1018 TaxID=3074636 RepID=UPI0029654E61|nr:hypothetical protein [Vibrio sp. Vb1018]MDW1821129.1 hypothetical protein [Vibrio sp. Vb1018]